MLPQPQSLTAKTAVRVCYFLLFYVFRRPNEFFWRFTG